MLYGGFLYFQMRLVRQRNLPVTTSYSSIFKYFHLTGDKSTFYKANSLIAIGGKGAIYHANVRAILRIKTFRFAILNGNLLQRYLRCSHEVDLPCGAIFLIFLKGQPFCGEATSLFYDYGGALVVGELSRPFEDEGSPLYYDASSICCEGGPGQLHPGARTNLHATPTFPYAKPIALHLSLTLYPYPYLPEPRKTYFPKG